MTTAHTATPAHFNKDQFVRGQKVQYGDFEAVIQEHYYEGMWNIRLPGGPACVSGAYLVPIA